MSAPNLQIVIDCADPASLAAFWAAMLDYQLQQPPPGFDTWPAFLAARGIPEDTWNDFSAIIDPEGARPRIFFQRVPEGKTVKNRVHLDVNAGGPHGTSPEERKRNVDDAVERALGLGATKLYAMEQKELDDSWVTMADPEGNEFCIQ